MIDDLDAFGEQFTEQEQHTIERYLNGATRSLRAYADSLAHDQERQRSGK